MGKSPSGSALSTKPSQSHPTGCIPVSWPVGGRGGPSEGLGVDGEMMWMVRWCGRYPEVSWSDAPLFSLLHALQRACNRAQTQPSEGLCSVPSKAALSLPELVELFRALLPRNAACWWYSNSVSGAFLSLGAIHGVFTDITLTRHQKPHSQ